MSSALLEVFEACEQYMRQLALQQHRGALPRALSQRQHKVGPVVQAGSQCAAGCQCHFRMASLHTQACQLQNCRFISQAPSAHDAAALLRSILYRGPGSTAPARPLLSSMWNCEYVSCRHEVSMIAFTADRHDVRQAKTPWCID